MAKTLDRLYFHARRPRENQSHDFRHIFPAVPRHVSHSLPTCSTLFHSHLKETVRITFSAFISPNVGKNSGSSPTRFPEKRCSRRRKFFVTIPSSRSCFRTTCACLIPFGKSVFSQTPASSNPSSCVLVRKGAFMRRVVHSLRFPLAFGRKSARRRLSI